MLKVHGNLCCILIWWFSMTVLYDDHHWHCLMTTGCLVRRCEWIFWLNSGYRTHNVLFLSLRLDLIQTLPSDFLIGLRSCCNPDWLNISADIEFNSVKTNCDRFPQTGREVFCCFRVLQIKGQFWHRLSQIFSKKCDISRKCVRGFETNKRIIGIVKIVLVFSSDQSRPI